MVEYVSGHCCLTYCELQDQHQRDYEELREKTKPGWSENEPVAVHSDITHAKTVLDITAYYAPVPDKLALTVADYAPFDSWVPPALHHSAIHLLAVTEFFVARTVEIHLDVNLGPL